MKWNLDAHRTAKNYQRDRRGALLHEVEVGDADDGTDGTDGTGRIESARANRNCARRELKPMRGDELKLCTAIVIELAHIGLNARQRTQRVAKAHREEVGGKCIESTVELLAHRRIFRHCPSNRVEAHVGDTEITAIGWNAGSVGEGTNPRDQQDKDREEEGKAHLRILSREGHEFKSFTPTWSLIAKRWSMRPRRVGVQRHDRRRAAGRLRRA